MQHRHEARPRPRRATTSDAEELVVTTIAAHADALLRTARRHSLCLDDAQDAYQRGLEIFLRHAGRLDPERASRWLHTVVKHEAMAVRAARQKLVGGDEFDADTQVAGHVDTPEERLMTTDVVARSAEALQRLKPQEVRALWLKAEGHSYQEIADRCGWTYTKVNRCVTEGRKAFLARYAGIESGEECDRWAGVLSAVVDGEAGAEDLAALRPHLRNCAGCRATLRGLRETRPALGALFPVALVVGTPAAGDAAVGLLVRVYEAVVGGLQERAVSAVAKAQALVEATGAAKVTAVAASAAAVAGGGAATVERVAERPAPAPAKVAQVDRPDAAVAPRPAPGVRVVPVSRARGAGGAATRPSAPARRSMARREARRRTTAAAARERRAARKVQEFGVEGVEGVEAGGGAAPSTTARAAGPQGSTFATQEFTTAAAPAAAAPVPASSGSSSSRSASSTAVADEFGPEG